jgi:hypothetical protein
MNFSSIAGSLFGALTGTNPSDLAAQASAAEQNIILAVEIIVALMLLMTFELFILIRKIK